MDLLPSKSLPLKASLKPKDLAAAAAVKESNPPLVGERKLAEDGWAFVAGAGTLEEGPAVTDAQFRDMVEGGCQNSDGSDRFCIIRRVCDSCTASSHRDIFYQRLTPLPATPFDFLRLFRSSWTQNPSNTLHTDFELYS